MFRLFRRRMISAVKFFRRNHFFRKNDFFENIFRRLACTKKSSTAKNGIRQRPIAVIRLWQARFQPNSLTYDLIRLDSDCTGRNLDRFGQSPAEIFRFQQKSDSGDS